MGHEQSTSSDSPPLFQGLSVQVLHTFTRVFGIAGPLVTAISLIQGVREHLINTRFVVLAVLMVALPAHTLLHKYLAPRVLALVVIVHLFAISTSALVLGGLTPGGPLVQVVSILLAALFFARRGALLTLGAYLLSLMVVGALWTEGALDPQISPLWDVHTPTVWVRYAVLLVVLCGVLAITFVSLVQKLETTNRELAQTLQREREERAAHEALQRVLERSQRLHALGQLAAGLAHDIGNNLMVLDTGTELILRDPGATENIIKVGRRMAESLGTTRASLKQIRCLGSDSGNVARVTVAEPLAELERALRPTLPPNISLNVAVSVSHDLFVDYTRLKQALLNLAFNARDAMPGGGDLSVLAAEQELTQVPPAWQARSGRHIVLSVRDTGHGMDAATQERVFEPLFTTKGERGTGLGLAMVHTFVYDARGFIEVESQPQRGSTFRMFLPAL